MKKMAKEFFTFIAKGNIIDLAVAVMIGTGFQRVVSSLVNNVFMPLISWIGGTDLSEWFITLKPGIANNTLENTLVTPPSGWEIVPIRLAYGLFIQALIDFFVIALVLFVIVKIAKQSSFIREKIKKDIELSLKKPTKKT